MFQFDWLKWDSIVGKIVRGMVFHDLKVPLPKEYVVQSWRGNGFWEDIRARHNIDQMSDQWANMGADDDVFVGKRGYDVNDPNLRVFLLVFYQSVSIFAWTTLAANMEFPDPSHPDQVATAIRKKQQQKRR